MRDLGIEQTPKTGLDQIFRYVATLANNNALSTLPRAPQLDMTVEVSGILKLILIGAIFDPDKPFLHHFDGFNTGAMHQLSERHRVILVEKRMLVVVNKSAEIGAHQPLRQLGED